MNDISDPEGAGRGDRRRARKVVDAAYAQGRITAADRSLRIQQVEAAATRGDLAMVVRDLTGTDPTIRQAAAPTTAPAPAVDASSFRPPAVDPQKVPRPQQVVAAGVTPEGLRRRKLTLLVVVVALVVAVPCVGGLVGVVSSTKSAFDRPRPSTSPSAATELVAGTSYDPATWRRFVADLEEEYGADVQVWSMFAYPDRYAGYVVVEGDLSQFVTWSDGRLGNSLDPRDESGRTKPFPLSDIDPTVLRTVAKAAADEAGSSTLRSLYVYMVPSTYDDSFYRGSASLDRRSSSVRFDRDGNRIEP